MIKVVLATRKERFCWSV